MEEPLDSVTVRLRSAEVTLPIDTRQDLLMQFGQDEVGRDIRAAFAEAGASHPIELTAAQKTYVLAAIERRTIGGDHGLPEEILALRNALIDDLREVREPVDAPRRTSLIRRLIEFAARRRR